MHGTHVELSISTCINKRQVTTTTDGNVAAWSEIQGGSQQMAVTVG